MRSQSSAKSYHLERTTGHIYMANQANLIDVEPSVTGKEWIDQWGPMF